MAREQRAVNDRMQELSRQNVAWEEEAWQRVDPVLNEALARLSSVERVAILLRYFDELSLAECGHALGLTSDAARMRIGRALGKMRRHLQRSGVVVSAAALTALLAHQADPAAAALAVAAPALCASGLAIHLQVAKGVLFKMNMLVWKPVIICVVGAGTALSIPVVAPLTAAPVRTLVHSHRTAAIPILVSPKLRAADTTPNESFLDDLFTSTGAGASPQTAAILALPRQTAGGSSVLAVAPAIGTRLSTDKPLSGEADLFAVRFVLPADLLPSEARALLQQLASQTVDEDRNTRTKQILTALRGLLKSYTVSARLDEAVAVRQGVRDFKERMAGILADPGNLTAYRGNVGRSYIFSVVGQTNGAESNANQWSLSETALLRDEVGSISIDTDLVIRDRATNYSIVRGRGAVLSDGLEKSTAGTMLDYSLSLGNLSRISATVWGSDFYTDDSPLAAVAVHAGILREGEKGVVRVTIFAGRDEYEGTARHGVTSRNYGAWDGSYMVEQAPPFDPITAAKLPDEAKRLIARLGPAVSAQEEAFNETLSALRNLRMGAERAAYLDVALVLRDSIAATIAARLGAQPDPGTLTEYRGHNGRRIYFQVTGRTNGSIWGSDTYTDDTELGTAAVHAGLLKPGQTGVVKVTVLPGLSGYSASQRNGIAATAYGEWNGSYRVELVTTY